MLKLSGIRSLVHYVEDHGVALPDEFVRHARDRRGTVPALAPPLQLMAYASRTARLVEFVRRRRVSSAPLLGASPELLPRDLGLGRRDWTIDTTFWESWFQRVKDGAG